MSETATTPSVVGLRRPGPSLRTYYLLRSLVLGPLFPVLFIPLWFRFHTLRYRFDDDGISMSWGVLFRREIHLTYSRIQDIHLVSNIVERWLALARIQIQTASGSAKAEMTIEGLADFEALRDFIYARMRGGRDRRPLAPSASAGFALEATGSEAQATTAVLREVAAELRRLREALERQRGDRD